MNTNIFRPLHGLTLDQMNSVYSVVEDIIDSLDDAGIAQLMSGNQDDIDGIISVLTRESALAMYSTGKEGAALNVAFDYLDRLSVAFEEVLRVASLNYFILTVLDEFDLEPHIIEWGNLIQLYRLLALIAARDHSKSYTVSFAYPLWRMYRYDPNSEIFDRRFYKDGMIITNEFKLAKHLLSMVKSEIEDNPILSEKLYRKRKDGWGNEAITAANGTSLVVKSYGSKMRGYHPHWVAIDDFLNESTLYSIDQKNKYITAFHSIIMNMLRKGGQGIVVGTPFIDGDLYSDLKRRKGWRVFEYPAIMPDGRVLYRRKHTIESLFAKRDEIGSVNFSREILVTPISSESSVCPLHIIKRSYDGMDKYVLVPNRRSHPVTFKYISVGTDFAFSASAEADWNKYYVVGLDVYNKYWLIHVFSGLGLSYGEQMEALRAINLDFAPDVIVIETVGGQKIFYDMAIDMGLPAIPHYTNTDKYSLNEGLPALGVLFERGDMRLPRGDEASIEMTDRLAIQLSSFSYIAAKGKLVSVSDHDDDAMALWQAVRGIRYCIHDGFNFSII